MLYASSKSDIHRLDEVARVTGLRRDNEAGAKLLDLVNRIWRTNTVPSRFISDSMVATWIDNEALRRDMPELLGEPDQYRLLGWYCCARLLESGCRFSREPVDCILDRMAREIVAESPNSRLPYTALMMSIYHWRSDVRDVVSLRGESGRPAFLAWYYTHGIRELGIVHHVRAEEWAVLNAPADNLGYDTLSLLCLFVLDWMPHPDFDLASPEDRVRAWAWFTQQHAGSAEPLAGALNGHETGWLAPGDIRLAPAPAIVDRGSGAAGDSAGQPDAPPRFGEQQAVAPHGSKYGVEWQTAEYFDRRGAGSRLLLSGEWFAAEELFSWSHAPWASLVFQPSGPIEKTVNLGLLLHATADVALLPDRQLTIYVNGNIVWGGFVRDAAGRELIVGLPGRHIRAGAVNLVQFQISQPFVPAESMASADFRKLGVPLQRLWIDQSGGLGRAADRTGTPQLHGPMPAPAGQGNEKLLVLRGDLLSHTGYAKEARALAGLVPGHFRTIGVDIHPDPFDNQAVVPFPIVLEAEALKQVAEHRSRCTVVHCTAPDDFTVWPNAWNVGWPSWETDAVPYLREWPLRIGLMDAIWAKTAFMETFVRRAGYRGPVHSVPWPQEFARTRDPSSDSAQEVSTSYFEAILDLRRPYRLRLLGDLRSEARLLFLAVQSMAPRKGLPLLLSEWRSHVEGSGGGDILVLRLAFRHAAGLSADWEEMFLEALATAGFRRGGPVRIALIPTALSDAELTGMYRAADGFLSMTFGEGFGGPIAEAIQNDRPVIAPRHTGLCDLIPENYPLIVSSARMAVALKGNLPAYPHSASWFIPKAGELRKKLEEFAAMTVPERRQLVEDCRKYAMNSCWTPVVRQRLAAALDDLERGWLDHAGLDHAGFDHAGLDRREEPVSSLFATALARRHAAD